MQPRDRPAHRQPVPRIVFIHSSDELYGADRVLLDVASALPDDVARAAEFWLPTDIEHGPFPLCTVLTERGLVVRHVPVPILRRDYLNPRGLISLAAKMLTVAARLRRARPDVVYLTTSAVFLVAPVARVARVPEIVGHVQELWSTSDARRLSRFAGACDRLIAISKTVKQALPAPLQPRTGVVLNATAAPPQVPQPPAGGLLLRFLMCGRWNSWKGHATLLEAWDRIEGHQLVVLGGPPPSGESFDVPARVAQLARPESVQVLGEVADVGPHIEACDVMVVPSLNREGFGLVAAEALARGRPVLASRAGGLVEVVTDGHDGWLVPPGDADALATRIASLDRAAVRSAALAARDTYEQRFTADRYAVDWRAAMGLGLDPLV